MQVTSGRLSHSWMSRFAWSDLLNSMNFEEITDFDCFMDTLIEENPDVPFFEGQLAGGRFCHLQRKLNHFH